MTIFLMPPRSKDRDAPLARLETVLVPMLIGHPDEGNGGFAPSNDNQLSSTGPRPAMRRPKAQVGI